MCLICSVDDNSFDWSQLARQDEVLTKPGCMLHLNKYNLGQGDWTSRTVKVTSKDPASLFSCTSSKQTIAILQLTSGARPEFFPHGGGIFQEVYFLISLQAHLESTVNCFPPDAVGVLHYIYWVCWKEHKFTIQWKSRTKKYRVK